MHLTRLSLAGLTLALETADPVKIDRELEIFLTDDAPDFTLSFRTEAGRTAPELLRGERGDRITLLAPESWAPRLAGLRGLLIEAPIRALLLERERFLLHASVVRTPLGGILFSGVCGIGKSTQAALWQRCRGGEILNGDRALLSREAEGWRVYGSPYAGSSGYFVRGSAPVRAIVLLARGGENTVAPVGRAEAFQRLFLQSDVDHRYSAQIQRLCALLERLIEEIPVYCLTCTPDEGAVAALETELAKQEQRQE